MKTTFALAAALLAAPLAASPVAPHLAGVSDQETTISYGNVQQFERGHGDVIFVRDQINRWYRLGLNKGCLRGTQRLDRAVFHRDGPGDQIDRFTRVVFPEEMRSCAIQSIRRSAPPPQVDRHSPVTLG